MTSIKTLIFDQINQQALDYGNNNLEIITWEHANMVKYYPDAEAVMVRTFKMTPEVIDAMPNLKIIAKHGVGTDNIDVEYAKEKGIVVTNTPAANMNSVAELVIALALACARKIVDSNMRVKNGIEQNSPLDLRGIELSNKKVGLIGLGKIGATVGKIFSKAFDMQVLVYDKYVSKEECAKLDFIKHDSLDNLLSESDIISISVPLTSETENMITTRELSLMKNDAILINTSRGKIINEWDLYNHLKDGQLFGAAIDAFEVEPVEKDNPLLTCDNFIATPHNGANTEEALIRMGTEAFDEIIRLNKGLDNLNVL